MKEKVNNRGSRIRFVRRICIVLVILLAAALAGYRIYLYRAEQKAEDAVKNYLNAYTSYNFTKAASYSDDEMAMTLLYDALPDDIYDYIDYYSEKTGLTGTISKANDKRIQLLTDQMYGDYIKRYSIGKMTGTRTSKKVSVKLTMGYDPHVLNNAKKSSAMTGSFSSYNKMVSSLLDVIRKELNGSKKKTVNATFYVDYSSDSGKWLVTNLYVKGYTDKDVLLEQGDSASGSASSDETEGMTDQELEDYYNNIEDNEDPEIITDENQ